MDIIVNIHPLRYMAKIYINYLRSKFAENPKTFFIVFPIVREKQPRAKNMMRWLSSWGLPRENLFVAEIPKGMTDFRHIESYEESFLKIIESIKSRAPKNEKVNVITMGGHAKVCYADLNEPVHKAIEEVFGKERMGKRYTDLRFVWGKKQNPPNFPILTGANLRNKRIKKKK